MANPQRWRPTHNSTGRVKAIMAAPSTVDEGGNALTFKVWPNGSPEREWNAMTWKAETLRRFFRPSGGDDG